MKTRISKSGPGPNHALAATNHPGSAPDDGDRLHRIATAAYYKAETRGFVPGQEVDDWLQAEADVDAATQPPTDGLPTVGRAQAARDDN